MSSFYYFEQSPCPYTGLPILHSVKAEGCPMPDAYLDGRPVYYGDICHGEDASDSYFQEAFFADTDEPLNENELQRLTDDNAPYLDEQWFENALMRAEAYRDRDR